MSHFRKHREIENLKGDTIKTDEARLKLWQLL